MLYDARSHYLNQSTISILYYKNTYCNKKYHFYLYFYVEKYAIKIVLNKSHSPYSENFNTYTPCSIKPPIHV